MAELSALTGVSVRSIQEGFQKHRGHPPLVFLRLLRLAKARELLSRGDCSVTGAALACGFEHLGRFSVQYRAYFGESPSRTLAEACARRAGAVPE
jgi:transcriptional regulator GlxA family with amidase domain